MPGNRQRFGANATHGLATVAPTTPPGHNKRIRWRAEVGKAITSPLLRCATPSQALEIARSIDPFGRAIDRTLPNRDRANYRRVASELKVVKSNRRKVLRGLTQIADKQRPL